jgi:Bifunctional DNA primase/polymerase, N-terminal/Primase C terminal 2 (PriCT-2)/AAA domain
MSTVAYEPAQHKEKRNELPAEHNHRGLETRTIAQAVYEKAVLAAALAYARRGWPVFPCKPRSKAPLTEHGFHDASTDPTIIRQWFTRWPDANIAIATGARSGFIVIDEDRRHGGHLTRDLLEHEHGPFPKTVKTRTSDGAHRYYQHPGVKVRCDNGGKLLGPGLDIKGDDGYVLVPPSLHPDGPPYAFALTHGPDDTAIAPLPEWITEKLTPQEQPQTPASSNGQPVDLARVKAALTYIPASLPHDPWVAVGMALHSVDAGEAGYALWVQWSQTCPQKFDLAVCQRKWASFTTERDHRIGIGTLFYYASSHGWQDGTGDRNGAGHGEEKNKARPSFDWSLAKDARVFAREPRKAIEGIVKDIVFPGVATMLTGPKGICKSLIAVKIAIDSTVTNGTFRGAPTRPVRALYLDRENPEQIVQTRLLSFGVEETVNFKILTREQDPPFLTDREAWARFPVEAYDVVILDSVGSFTAGVTEKEGKETTLILDTIKDLTTRGPALVLLNNTEKTGTNVRGRGEWANQVDVHYEIRDMTGVALSGKKPWTEEIPPDGAADWHAREARRRGKTSYRLAFFVEKFRIGQQPDPFVVELSLTGERWTLTDATATVEHEVEAAKTKTRDEKDTKLHAAASALAEVVTERFALENPILLGEAMEFLQKERHLSRDSSRQLITDQAGGRWDITPLLQLKGHPKALVPHQTASSTKSPGEISPSAGEINPSGNPHESSGSEEPISPGVDSSTRRNTPSLESAQKPPSPSGAFLRAEKSIPGEMPFSNGQKSDDNSTLYSAIPAQPISPADHPHSPRGPAIPPETLAAQAPYEDADSPPSAWETEELGEEEEEESGQFDWDTEELRDDEEEV